MGRYALSLNRRKRNSSLAKETVLDYALDTFRAGQHSSAPPNASQAADQFGISTTTFWRRIHGGRSNKEAHEAFQLLTPSEEEVLVHLAQTREHCQAAGKKQPKRPPMIKKAKTPMRFTEQLAEDKDKENDSEDGQPEETQEGGSDSD